MYAHTLKVQKLDPKAIMPTKAHADDAGYDLSSIEDVVIEAGNWRLVRLGLALTVPIGTYGRIAPRSGLSTKGLNVGAGVVDRGYTGEIKVLLFNHRKTDYSIKAGDRIAQLILEKIQMDVTVQQVNSLKQSDTRGAGGFGSTDEKPM